MLCLITGEVFKPGPFEKPAKVARQRVKKGPPQRIGSWRQGNSFAPLAALGGGGLPEPAGLLVAAVEGAWVPYRARHLKLPPEFEHPARCLSFPK